jgi:hypothetical protein
MFVRLLKPPHAPCPSNLLLRLQGQKLSLGLGVFKDLDHVGRQFTPTFDEISHFH